MNVVYISFVFLLANEIRKVSSLQIGVPRPDDYYVGGKRITHIPVLVRRPTGFHSDLTDLEVPISEDPPNLFNSETYSSARQPSRILRLFSSSGPNSNPCDKTAVNNGMPSAHDSCLAECLAKQTEISNLFRAFPDSRSVRFLYDRCGSVTDGRCSYYGPATFYPICMCHTPNEGGSQSVPLFLCRSGIPMVRTFANTGNGIQRIATAFGYRNGQGQQNGNTDNSRPRTAWNTVSQFMSGLGRRVGGEEEREDSARQSLALDGSSRSANTNNNKNGGEEKRWKKPRPDSKWVPRRSEEEESSKTSRSGLVPDVSAMFPNGDSRQFGGEEESWRKPRPDTKWIPRKNGQEERLKNSRSDVAPDLSANGNNRQFGGEETSWNKPSLDSKPEWIRRKNRDEERLKKSRSDVAPDVSAMFANGNSRQFGREEESVEPEEEDNESEGTVLVIDLRISRRKIRAVVDTGSALTVFHKNLAKNYLPLEQSGRFGGANNQAIKLFGKTTLQAEIKKDIIIPVYGFVADMPYDIILGNDFFVKYSAKIQISKRTMEISYGQTVVIIPIKFRAAPAQIAMINSADPGGYTPLTILARLNGREVNICIDTGASVSIASKSFVNQWNIRRTPAEVRAPDDSALNLLGETALELSIGAQKYSIPALVLHRDFHHRNLIHAAVVGNSFNKDNVEVIDYEQRVITLKTPDTHNLVTVQIFVTEDE